MFFLFLQMLQDDACVVTTHKLDHVEERVCQRLIRCMELIPHLSGVRRVWNRIRESVKDESADRDVVRMRRLEQLFLEFPDARILFDDLIEDDELVKQYEAQEAENAEKCLIRECFSDSD